MFKAVRNFFSTISHQRETIVDLEKSKKVLENALREEMVKVLQYQELTEIASARVLDLKARRDELQKTNSLYLTRARDAESTIGKLVTDLEEACRLRIDVAAAVNYLTSTGKTMDWFSKWNNSTLSDAESRSFQTWRDERAARMKDAAKTALG